MTMGSGQTERCGAAVSYRRGLKDSNSVAKRKTGRLLYRDSDYFLLIYMKLSSTESSNSIMKHLHS